VYIQETSKHSARTLALVHGRKRSEQGAREGAWEAGRETREHRRRKEKW